MSKFDSREINSVQRWSGRGGGGEGGSALLLTYCKIQSLYSPLMFCILVNNYM